MTIEPMLTEEMPASVLVGVLRKRDRDGIGISGGHTGRIVSGLSQYPNSIRTVLVREESLGGVMAEIYGRLTRRLGAARPRAWVLGGRLSAYRGICQLADAVADRSQRRPALRCAPYQQATMIGKLDARRAFGVTKRIMQAHDPIAAVQDAARDQHALAGQPGPVAVLYSHDSLAGSVADSQPALYPTCHYLRPCRQPGNWSRQPPPAPFRT